MSIAIALLVFIGAGLHEVFCVAFIYYAERKNAFMTGVVAMIAGQCSVTAWLLSIEDKQYIPFMLIGWGVGAFIGVKIHIGSRDDKELND